MKDATLPYNSAPSSSLYQLFSIEEPTNRGRRVTIPIKDPPRRPTLGSMTDATLPYNSAPSSSLYQLFSIEEPTNRGRRVTIPKGPPPPQETHPGQHGGCHSATQLSPVHTAIDEVCNKIYKIGIGNVQV